MDNLVVPWSPLPDLPQWPCVIAIEGAPEEVTVRVAYSFYEGERDLLIDFKAEIFACFSDIAAPDVSLPPDYPRLTDLRFARYLWPLMEIKNSSWAKSYADRLWVRGADYRHFRLVSDDGTFDAIVLNDPFARWVLAQPSAD